jgi:ectoine hydroxylase-related dioxygenase (phytanoyl-CoA dioxygenase family)
LVTDENRGMTLVLKVKNMKESSLLPNVIMRARSRITPEHIAAYKKDGAVCIRHVLLPEEIELLTNGVELNLRYPSHRVKIASKENDPGKFIEDFCTWQSNPYYKKFIFESPVSFIAKQLMESKISRLYHDHLLVKEPGTQQRTPWHQDQPYYNVDGKQNCSFWIPIDAVTRASTLEFIAGSHLGPWFMPRSFMDNQAKWFPEGSLTELPDIDSNRDNYPIIGWEVNPGDLVCFHMLTLHSANGVEGNRRRRVFSVRFLGDDITHAPRPWITSPDFPGLKDELPARVQMDHALFPIIGD